MTFGGKYKWKTDSNPGPGYYTSRFGITESRSTSAVTMNKRSGSENRSQFLERNKTDGCDRLYDHTTAFGSDVRHKMHFGARRESKL